MSAIWRKVWRDMALNKGRTLLTVLSIAVGVFALGVIYGAYDTISRRLDETQRLIGPVHVTLWGPFDEDAEQIVSHSPDVTQTEMQVDAYMLWKLEGEANWRDATLMARQDYRDQRLERITLVEGVWPDKHNLAIERQAAKHFGIPIGGSVIVKTEGSERRLLVTGVVHDYTRVPPQAGGYAVFYATPEAAAALTSQNFNRMEVRLQGNPDQDSVSERTAQIEARLQRADYPLWGNWVREPEHWFQDAVDTMLVILTILGTLSLGMSAFLVINTMNALITQQVWQIGVIKTLGGTSWRVLRIYLATALLYGSMALLIAVPLSALGARLLAEWLLDHHANIDMGFYRVSPLALAIQLSVGLVAPPLAALTPVIGGARISPHRAISSYGLGGGFGRAWLDRLLGNVRFLPRPAALSLRNTFRRKARVLLTLTMLALGGVMFVMVMGVKRSFLNTIDVLLSAYGDDLRIGFEQPQLVERLTEIAQSMPGVIRVEIWGRWGTQLKLADGTNRYIGLRSLPLDSQIFNPTIVAGRSLLPGDDHAILLNHAIAMDEGIQVGDQVRFDIRERETVWTVVGLILFPEQSESFVPFDALAQEAGIPRRGWRVHVVTDRHDLAYQQRMVESLRAAYAAHNMETTWAWSTGEMREQQWQQYSTIHYLLLAMALLAALVGGIGLMGVMSINVVERRREIGVMRATGAASLAIVGIFVTEGVLLGALSWLIAVPFSFPAARFASRMIGQEMLQYPLVFAYSFDGMALWLGIVLVLATLASLWPALQASQVSVREALAYE